MTTPNPSEKEMDDPGPEDICLKLRSHLGTMHPGVDRTALRLAIRTAERLIQDKQSAYARGVEDAARCCETFTPEGWDIRATNYQDDIAAAIRRLIEEVS